MTPSGERLPGSIRVSLPTPAADGESQCEYSIEPIAKRRGRVCGVDDLQALLLALQLCGTELAIFEKTGGTIEFPPSDDEDAGERWDPAVYFGPFLRIPKAPDSK